MILGVENELKSLSRIDPDSEANRESLGLVHLKYAQGKKKIRVVFLNTK